MLFESKSTFPGKFVLAVGSIFLLFFLSFSGSLKAEGSKEMADAGGNRAYFYSRNGAATASLPYPTQGKVFVYAEAGETLYLGSSAIAYRLTNGGNGEIRVTSPNGIVTLTTTLGAISTRAQELAGPSLNNGVDGGYVPFTVPVVTGQTGVWQIEFIAPTNADSDVPVRPATTIEQTNTSYIAAFDVSVRNFANTSFIPGRAYLNSFSGNMGSFSSRFSARFKILTKDGYIYDVNNNGQAGYRFVFFANNKGFKDDVTGDALYKSVNTTTNAPVHDPRNPDGGTDITHKIFFNQPDANMPASAVMFGGSTWLFNTPTSPTVSDFLFEGKEGTTNFAGTYPLGGYISFNTNQTGSYILKIDANKNNSFNDLADVRLTGIATNGDNQIFWDGLDGQGVPVGGNFSFNPANMTITLVGGEVHFPFLDVENNPDGIIITRTNGVNAPNDIVYWDDDDITGGTGPSSNPTATTVNGISSAINGHEWGNNGFNEFAFGNEVGLDTWAYVISTPVLPFQAVWLREADLQVQSITPTKTSYCSGENVIYTVAVKNNGPDDVSGSKFAFNFPSEFTVSGVTYTTSGGAATVSSGAISTSDYTATLDMENQAVITFTVTGKATAYPAGGVLSVNASIMRPADVTDPDATNDNNAPPVDPLEECNSGVVGCNNLLANSQVNISTRNINIASSGASEGTGGTSNITFPVNLSATSACDITVDYTLTHGTTTNADFVGSLTGTITIPAGQISANIIIPIATDNIIEVNEDFTITLSNASGSNQIVTATATGTINNDDFAEITTTKADGYEEGSIAGKFIFSLPSGITADKNIEIDYTLEGTGLGGGVDYTENNSGTVTILAGQSTAEILISVVNDVIVEGTEDVLLNIAALRSDYSAPSGSSITLNASVNKLNIFDNDKATLTINPSVTLNEGNSGDTDFVFNITLDAQTSSPFTLNFKTTDGIALVSDNDYESKNEVINFTGIPGTYPVIVKVNGDDIVESSEYFHVIISDLSNTYNGNLTITQPASVGNILNDDSGILDITSVGTTEGAAAAQFVFTLRDGKVADTDIVINYTLTGKANGSGIDYDKPQTGTITLLKGQNLVRLYLNTYDDNLIEGTEAVVLTVNSLSHPAINLPVNTQSLDILDLNSAMITVADVQVTEGNAGTTTLSFKVLLTGRTDTDFTLPFTIQNQTTNAADYTLATISPISFSPNLATQEISIDLEVNGDYDIEGNETLQLVLGTPSKLFNGHLITQAAPAIGTILDDDSGQITVTPTHGKEENEEPVVFTFAFPAGVTSVNPTTINFTLAGSTAISGEDYVAPVTYQVTIPAGQNSMPLSIALEDDDIIEGTQTIVLTPSPIIGNPGVTINTASVIAQIEDNDTGTITITGPANMLEGDVSVNTVVNYTIKLDKAIQSAIQLSYRTADVTAFAGEDYDGVLNTYTFLSGLSEQEITVPVTIRGDRKIEASEIFRLMLNPLLNDFGGRITLPSPFVETTIQNDDQANIVITKIDGIEGSQNARFTIGFENNYSTDVPLSIPYTLGGTAINGTDYTGIAAGTITINPGQTAATLDLVVINDNLVEDTETVTLTLSNTSLPYGIAFAELQKTLNIVDNDNAQINISNASVIEGSGADTYLVFDVALSGAEIQQPFSLTFSIADGTGTVGQDYEIPASATLNFNGQSDRTKQIQVLVKGDFTIEKDETLQMILGALSHNFEGRLTINNATATGTIINNDKGNISITPTNGNEQGEVAGSFVFTFLNGITSDEPTIINFNLSGVAQVNADFTVDPLKLTSITIPAGQTSATLDIEVIDDTIIEGAETVTLTTSGMVSPYAPAAVTIANSPQTLNILDNDMGQLVLTAEPDVTEGPDGQTKTVKFKVKLSHATAYPFSVAYQFTDINATNGNDYIASNGTWSFLGNAGEEQEVTVTINGDYKIEGNESFRFQFNNPSNGYSGTLTIPQNNHIFTIINDDTAQLSITKEDGEEGGDDGYFTISLPTGYTIDQPLQISYTLGGTAVAADYAALPGIITLPANTSSINIPIAIVNDDRIEGDEFVNLTANIVSPIYGTSFVNNTSSLKITDNDYGTVSINNVAVNEGDVGEFTLSFNVTLDKETGATFDVNYSTANGSATAGEDYEAKTNNTITFAGAAGETQHIEIKYFGDKKVEADETFNVILQSLSKTFNGHLAISTTEHTGTATLLNDDAAVVGVQVTNGSESGTKGVFRFYLENGAISDKDITLSYLAGGSALNIPAEKDYDISHPLTITIPAGQPYADVELTIEDDAIVEGTETVELLNLQLFSDHSDVTLSPAINAVLNIADNDTSTLQLTGPPDVNEGADGTTQTVTFNVVLSNPTQNPVTINFATADGTATLADDDYEPQTGQLVFPGEMAGETQSVSITINGDNTIEADELFSLILSNLNEDYGGLVTVPNATTTAKILNDDLGSITITAADGTEGLQDASFTFSFPTGISSDKPVSINYILGGSAGAGVDYTGALTGTVVIPAGQNSVTLTLPVINDTRVEGTETVSLTGTMNAASYGITITNTTPTTLNIFDNDVASISISDASITEGNSGTKTLSFNVTLNNETQGSFSVPYSTANGTATAGEDYVAVSAGSIIFAGTSGEVKQISIALNSDQKIEPDETLTVTLGALLNNFGGQLTILDGSATGTIINDDLGQITITPSNGNETGEIPGTFIFRLPSGKTVDRDIVIGFSLAGSATLGADYTDPANGTITIYAGDNQAILTLPVNDDNLVENTENIVLTTTSVSGPYAFLTIVNSPQSLNIIDNDVSALQLTGPPDVLEGADGTTQTVTFTVALNKATKGPFTIDYTTANLSAIAGEDYELNSGTLTFDGSANQAQTISITITGDNKIETSELFNLVLSNLSNNFGGLLTVPNTTATATILNDDLGNITITSADGTEGLSDASFTFSFPSGITSDKPTTINFGLGGTATVADYTANPSATAITIPAGQNSVTLAIEVIDDLVTELTETVILNATTVSNPYGIALDNTSETLSILDNDVATLSISAPAPFNEDNFGTKNVQFTVTLSGQTSVPFSVPYHTLAQTASGGEDFVAISGTLNFSGQANQSQTINVTINGDKKVEADELFSVVLDNLAETFEGRLSIAVNTATATILNDDSAVIKMTTVNGSEDGINGKIRFEFQNGVSIDQPTVLTYTLEGTANNGAGIDYTANFPTTITIPAGSTFAEIDLVVNNDDIIEDTETVEIANLAIASANANVTLDAARPVVDILDNDAATLQLLGPPSVVEGHSGLSQLIYTVKLNKATTSGFSISYATSDILANAGSGDYVSTNNTLNFAGNAGETQTFSVYVNGDTEIEANETFRITLGTPNETFNNQLTVLGSPLVVNIIDDDNDNINITNILDGEEDGDNGQFVFSLPAGTTVDIPLTISYTLSGSATNGVDYSLLNGTFVLPAFTNSYPLTIPVIDDELVEGMETVTINASVATNAYNIGINNPLETLNIIDNDVASISILPVSKAELDSGQSLLTFSVSLDKNTQEPFTLAYSTSNGTAIAGEDFTAPASGALISFQGNIIDAITTREVQTISVLVNGDTKIEADEWLNLTLGALSKDFESRVNIPVKTVRGTIENDDSGMITVTKQDGKEGEDDAAFIFSFPNGITSDTETVLNFALGGTALGGAVDYEALSASTVTIPAGSTGVTLNLEVNDDEIVEDTETVILQNLTLGATYPDITLNTVLPVINITDNDVASLTLSGPTSIPEGDLATSELIYTVTLNKTTTGSFRVDYSTANNIATVADNDYVSAAGFLDFTGSAGEAKTFKVFVIGDQKIEADEMFRIILNNLDKTFNNRLTIATPQTEVTIVNDDGGDITISSQNGAEPGTNGRFIFSLPNGISSDKDIVIDYSLSGSADEGQDYQATTGTITLPAKTNSAALPILVINDDKVEGTETVIINAAIPNPVNAIALQNTSSSLEIADEDFGTISINNVSVTEKNNGDHTLNFEVTLDKETEGPFTLSYSTADGTATAGEDYVAVLNGTLNFAGAPAGEVRQIAITYKGDIKVEANEVFNVILGSLSDNFGGRLTVSSTLGTGTATLENDDAALIRITAIDGSEDGTKGVFRFGFEGGASSDKPVTFEYNLSGTAGANDYTTTAPTTITIPAGLPYVDLELNINNDEIVEGTETVRLENLQIVTTYSGITLPVTLPDLNIADNDEAKLLLSGPHSVTEGDNGTSYIDFTLRLDKATASQFNVSYTTADGTATTANSDYVPQSSAFTFLGGKDETKTIRILVNGDQAIEPDEIFDLQLGNPSKTFENRLTIPVQATTGTIINDDSAAIVITKQDGAEGGQPASFTFTLANNKTVDEDIYINYTLDNTSALTGTDFTVSAPSPLLLEKGSTSVTLTLAVNDDNIVEGTETVKITAQTQSNPRNNIIISNTTETLNIEDNDQAVLVITNPQVLEGNSGETNLVFTVSINKPTQRPFTASYHTEDISATSGEDYIPVANGLVTFPGLSVAPQTITIKIKGDQKLENDETLKVLLTAVSEDFWGKLSLPAAAATGKIINDDAAVITISGTNGRETNETPGTFKFSLPNNIQSDQPIKINYTLSGDALGNGIDYTNTLSGFVTIPANASEATLNINVKEDNILEYNESVIINASIDNSTAYSGQISLSNNTRSIFIEDNDSATLTLSGAVQIPEGDDGFTPVVYTVALSNPVTAGFKVNYNVEEISALISDEDFQFLPGELQFTGANATSGTFTIYVKGDKKIEANETFRITLTPDVTFNNRLTVQGAPLVVEITNDDLGIITITKEDGEEIPDNSKPAKFTFSLPDGISADQDITLPYSLSVNSARGEDVDYTGNLTGNITIYKNDNRAVLTLPVIDDNIVEETETVTLQLGNVTLPYGITIPETSRTLNIFDNDEAQISISNATVIEGNSGTTYLDFTVSLNNTVQESFTINYHTQDGTATAGEDYQAISNTNGSLTFNALDVAPKNIRVNVNTDFKIEANETLQLVLQSLSNNFGGKLHLPAVAGIGTIQNDDSAVITISGNNGKEAGAIPGTFKFSLPANVTSDQPIKINYTLSGAALANGVDYTNTLSGEIIIPANAPDATLNINVKDDSIVEFNESVIITASIANESVYYPANISLANTTRTINIEDNDTAILSIDGPKSIVEGDFGTKTLTFNVTLSHPVASSFTVKYHSADGTATLADNDYQSVDGTLSFAGQNANETYPIQVTINGDTKIEGNEYFELLLDPLTQNYGGRVTITGSPARAIIQDDDNANINKVITITKQDGEEGVKDASFTFSFPPGVSLDTDTEIFFSLGGNAIKDADYQVLGSFSSIIIPAGQNSKTLNLKVFDDTIIEGTEDVRMITANINNSLYQDITISNPTFALNILDNDNGTITIDAVSITEGNANTKEMMFNVVLSNETSREFQLNYSTADGTATIADNDYVAVTDGVLVLGPLSATKQIKLLIKGDVNIEKDEIFNLVFKPLVDSFNGRLTLVNQTAAGKIVNDDSSVITIIKTDGEEGVGPVRFKFSFPANVFSDELTKIDYSLSGSAIANLDYNGNATGTIEILPYQNSVELVLPVVDDNLIEGTETVAITANAVSVYGNAITINPVIPVANIKDNDTAKLRINGPVTVTEGNIGTTSVNFTVTLEGNIGESFDVKFSTQDGSATIADNDYIPKTDNILNFSGNPGESKTITIFANGDRNIEANENFFVNLHDLSKNFNGLLTIENSPAEAIILDDDNNPANKSITVTRTNGSEVDLSPVTFTFSFPPGVVSDAITTIPYSLSGTATGNGVDYEGIVSGNIAIPAGENSITLTLPVKTDAITEGPEIVKLTTGEVINGSYNGIRVVNAIIEAEIEDANTTSLTIDDIEIVEGNTGTSTATFKLKLNGATAKPFTVDYQTANGTATVADFDYTARSGKLSFNGIANEEREVTITINGDKKLEADETFKLLLSNIQSNFDGRLVLDRTEAIATIRNDDDLIITVTGTNGAEAGKVAGRFVFSLPLGYTSDIPTLINYTLGGQATAGGTDYEGSVSGVIAIPAGEERVILSLSVIDDEIIEKDEDISITINSINTNYPSHITYNPILPTIKIIDNDATVLRLSNAVQLKEGNSGTTPFEYTLTLEKATGAGFTVKYTTEDGTATLADNDYNEAEGVLSFSGTAGESHTVTVFVNGDRKIETNELFKFKVFDLDSIFNNRLTIPVAEVNGIIENDDSSLITITKVDGIEGTQNGKFDLTLDPGVTSDRDITISYRLRGTATTSDYTVNPSVTTITIPAGQNSASIAINVVDDDFLEETESVVLSVLNVINPYNNVTVLQPIPILNIYDNDITKLTIISPAPIEEGHSGVKSVTFTVKLENTTDKGFTLQYSTVDGSATETDNDYQKKTGSLSFAGFGGETKTVTVFINGDTTPESHEFFGLRIFNPLPDFDGKLVLDTNGRATILNDDIAPIAADDFITIIEDTPETFSVITNDYHAEGINPATITVTVVPTNGLLVPHSDGTVTYSPRLNFFGNDSFTYTVRDIYGRYSNEARVNITVIPVNDAPIANDDIYYVQRDSSIRENVSLNDEDPDGDALVFRRYTNPEHGNITFFDGNDGSFIYVPTAGFKGIDKFSYYIQDPEGLRDTAEVMLYIQPKIRVDLTPNTGILIEGDTITITAKLTEFIYQDVNVVLNFGGTAEVNKDYILSGNYDVITIPARDTITTHKFSIHSLKDYLKEGEETIEVSMIAVDPAAFVNIGNGADIIIKDFYPDDKPLDPDENGDINPDPYMSPNGDDLGNERFVIYNIERYPDNEVIIYNRWGNEVYSTKGYDNKDNAFNGTSNKGMLANSNAPLTDGVYYFIIKTKDGEGKPKRNKGYVIIRR